MNAVERIKKTIRCEKVDHIPIIPSLGFFPARHKGISIDKYLNDMDLQAEVAVDMFDEFGGWDATFWSSGFSEFAWSLTQPLKLKMPGRELPPDVPYQFDEREVLGIEGYDIAIEGGFEAVWGHIFPKIRPHMDMENIYGYLEEMSMQGVKDTLIWDEMGIPTFTGMVVADPFDFFSFARSMKEFNFDLYRRPEKVLAAFEAIAPGLIANVNEPMNGMRQATKWGYLTVFVGCTRSSGSYISPKLFKKFAWPSMKQNLLALIEAGETPLLHFDADWGPMLEFFLELPQGTCVLELDGLTDIFKAKEVLNGHMCLMGDVPAALLKLGTPEEVTAYVRRLCEEVGEGGGFILSNGCEAPIDAKPENIRAMIEAGKEYGQYA